MRLNEAKTLDLVALYRREPCLWNSKMSSYRYKSKRAEAIERIAKDMNVKNLTAQQVTNKIKSLRNSYCAELKKMFEGRDDASEVKPKMWFLKMDEFLRPHVQVFPANATRMSRNTQKPIDFTKTSEREERPRNAVNMETAIDMLKDISAKLDSRFPKDKFDDFGHYVATILRGLPKHRSKDLQPRIINLIARETLKDEKF